jgi:hypothetical protein
MSLTTKCGSCGGAGWEIKTISPAGANYKINLVHCANCGVPVGALEALNAGALLHTQAAEIADLKKTLQKKGALIGDIYDLVRRISRQ